MMLYTVWHRVEHVIKDGVTREKPWLRENVTGLMYHKELTADSSYMFAVTAWNRWGESLLETDNMLFISTNFPERTGRITCSLLITREQIPQSMLVISYHSGSYSFSRASFVLSKLPACTITR